MKYFTLLFLLLIFITVPNYSQDTINVPGDYATIQEAIDAANNGDIVLVADGTYYENIRFRGKAITVGSHFLTMEDEAHIANTIINGSQPSDPDIGTVVSFLDGEDASSVLCGFTITGGTGSLATGIFGDRNGGGIYIASSEIDSGIWITSSATIKNNIIEYNSITNNSYTNGGGICLIDSDSTLIENNVIRYNTITGNEWSAGGGIAIYNFIDMGYVKIANNKVTNNTATDPNFSSGGGIENAGSGTLNEFYIIGNYIGNNICSGGFPYAGGLDIYNCSPVVKNNLIVGNSGDYGAGLTIDALTAESSKSRFTNIRERSYRYNWVNDNRLKSAVSLLVSDFENNTIINNSAVVEGGGVAVWNTALAQFMNFIVWGNTAPVDSNVSGTPNIQYSDVEGGYTGTGNIDLDPQFNPSSEFYGVLETSPCVDAGNPAAMYNDVENPSSLGNPLWPAWGTLTNDIGHCGGPASSWGQEWPIPVELTSFTATVSGYDINLSWSTATETNNMGFEIQRSFNRADFVKITFVEGHGTVTEISNYSFTDRNLEVGTYTYRLKQIDFDGTTEFSHTVEAEIVTIIDFALDQNYPNPFNPVTTIKYQIPNTSNVTLKIFNLLGEEIASLVNEVQIIGNYEVEFNATGLSSGVYYYKLQSGSFVETKKMILMK